MRSPPPSAVLDSTTSSMSGTRPPYFAMRVLRLATKTAMAQHHGTDVLALLTVIACQEDSRRYRGPVACFNSPTKGGRHHAG